MDNADRIRMTRARIEAEIADLLDAMAAVDNEIKCLQTRMSGLRGVVGRLNQQAKALVHLTRDDEPPM